MKTLNTCLVVIFLMLSSFLFAQPGPCDGSVPSFDVDLTHDPNAVYETPDVQRKGKCCDAAKNAPCVQFQITLHPDAHGIAFDVCDGAKPSGSLYYQIDCGPRIPVGEAICLDGEGPFTLTFCKPGANENIYCIRSLTPPVGGNDVTIQEGCDVYMIAEGYDLSTVVWTSIFPGNEGDYDYLLDCKAGCDSVNVNTDGILPAYIDYQVCGEGQSDCTQKNFCDTIRVNINPGPSIDLNIEDKVLCKPEDRLKITATVNGGTPPYTYNWSNGETDNQIEVGPGTYWVEVFDASGCGSAYAEYVIPNFTELTVVGDVFNVLCKGENTGKAYAEPSGGRPPYQIQWSDVNSQTGEEAENLFAGFYTATIIDSVGCETSVEVEVVEPLTKLRLEVYRTVDVKCKGNSTGLLEFGGKGGTKPYKYSLGGSEITSDTLFEDLPAGVYNVTVIDDNGCEASQTITIEEPEDAAQVDAEIIDVSCYGDNTGRVNLQGQGGTPAYNFADETKVFGLNNVFGGLAQGDYKFYLRDSKGCLDSVELTLNQPDTSIYISGAHTDLICNGDLSGSIDINAFGGTAPYSILWNDGNQNFSRVNLSGGNYSATITDANGCTKDTSIFIYEPAPIIIQTSVDNAICVNTATGSAMALATGGTAPFIYEWNDDLQQKNDTAFNLTAGIYEVLVRDSLNCEATATVEVQEDDSPFRAIIDLQQNVLCKGDSSAYLIVRVEKGQRAYNIRKVSGPTNPEYNLDFTQNDVERYIISNLSFGKYLFEVEDAVGCITEFAVNIQEPALALSSSIFNQLNVKCKGDLTGYVELFTNGGTPNYSYFWSNDIQNNSNKSDSIASGEYFVAIEDQNGCQDTVQFEITEPDEELSISATVEQNVSCKSGADGIAVAMGSGGTPGYSYQWNDPFRQSTDTANFLTAGSYLVTLTDANGCKDSTEVIITEPAQKLGLQIISIVDAKCVGDSSGSATVIANGGTPPYSYLWNDDKNQSGVTASGLAAGNYRVTVTDANGCKALIEVVVTAPEVPITSVVNIQNDVYCKGDSSAVVLVELDKGSPDYTLISNNTSPDVNLVFESGAQQRYRISNLSAGFYEFLVRDEVGCEVDFSFNIREPNFNLNLAATSVQQVLCKSENTGSIEVRATGGTSPYSYTWSHDATLTSTTATNLLAGPYRIIATDANGCADTLDVEITEPAQTLEVTAQEFKPVSCTGGTDGVAVANVQGGVSPYSFRWNDNFSQTTDTAKFLQANTYTVVVTDDNNCIDSAQVSITEPPVALNLTVQSIINTKCVGDSSGSATVFATGGTAPYSYLWNDDLNQTTETASNLPAGRYRVIVTDARGCKELREIEILNPVQPLLSNVFYIQDVQCKGDSSGVIAVSVYDGDPNYTITSKEGSPIIKLDSTKGDNHFFTISNLSVGKHEFVVTDQSGCQSIFEAVLTEPNNELEANVFAITNVTCKGAATGSAQARGIGGTAPYSFSWSNDPLNSSSQSDSIFAGTYLLQVIDANQCIDTISFTITEPEFAVDVQATLLKPVSCKGGSDGEAIAVGQGGISPYSYLWNDTFSQTTDTAVLLSAGQYKVIVNDANGCQDSAFVQITEPLQQLSITPQSTNNLKCIGDSSGSATVFAIGGTAPYTYAWNDDLNQKEATADSLPIGTYRVTVTDANNCVASLNVNIENPANPLRANVVLVSDVLCKGDSTGTATVRIYGGEPNYVLSQLNGSSQTQLDSIVGSNYFYSIAGLEVGNHQFSVTDKNACEFSFSINVGEPSFNISGNIYFLQDVLCFGDASGKAEAQAAGGVAPYTYNWSNDLGNTLFVSDSIPAGNHILVVSDNNLCTDTIPFEIIQPNSAIDVNAFQFSPVSCFGGNDAVAYADPFGGTAPYRYLWNDILAQTTDTAKFLSAKTYTVYVTDDNDCIDSATVTISEPAQALQITSVVTNDTKCIGDSSGNATIDVIGGTKPYTYLWNDDLNQTSATATGLPTGNYRVTVTDANGCTAFREVIIENPSVPFKSQVTFVQDVQCKGDSSAFVLVKLSNGSPEYSLISNSGNPQYSVIGGSGTEREIRISNLRVGSYVFTAKDQAGCEIEFNVTIKEPVNFLQTSLFNRVDVACRNENSGEAEVVASGGTSPYTFEWSSDATNQSNNIDSLFAGVYTVITTDNNLCTDTLEFEINQPDEFLDVDAIEFKSVSCKNGSDGVAVATGNGGTIPYQFLWNDTFNQTSDTAQFLSAGSYRVKIIDKNNCIDSTDVIITEPNSEIQITGVTIIDVKCFGDTTGAALAQVSGGTPPYSYQWNDPKNQTDKDAYNLSAGNYLVTVTDAKGCTDLELVNIPQPNSGINIQLDNYKEITCSGESTGSIAALVSGGTAPYIYGWSNGLSTNDTLENVPQGYYTLVVYDANACVDSAGISISEPNENLEITAQVLQDVSCKGFSDASIQATVSGGTTPYTITWNDPANQTGYVASGLEGGTYKAYVVDANSCTDSVEVTVVEPGQDIDINLNVSAVSCKGGSDGQAHAVISGGTAPYSYSWTDPLNQKTPIARNLYAGTYDVEVVDANGCALLGTAIITEPAERLKLTTVEVNPSCFGDNDGSIAASVTGGTAPYTFQWDDPTSSTSSQVFNLDIGEYEVVVKDQNNCVIAKSVQLVEPNPIEINIEYQENICQGQTRGFVTTDVSGGTKPYVFQWKDDNGNTFSDAAGLAPGIYEFTVTDDNGCKGIDSVEITSPTQIALDLNVTQVSCFDGSDGAIILDPNGAATPITYSWNSGQFTSKNLTNIPAGFYDLEMTDNNGCQAYAEVTVTQPNKINLSLINSNLKCFGKENAFAEVTASGGVEPYAYQWNDANSQQTPRAENLGAGTFLVQVTDANSCLEDTTLSITSPSKLSIDLAVTDLVCRDENTGEIVSTVTGGTTPYSYKWDNVNQSETPNISNLSFGKYSLVVTDANLCQEIKTATVNAPTSTLNLTSEFVDISCKDFTDGEISVVVQGGSEPYSFNWSHDPSIGINRANNLSAGSYTIDVTDASSCQKSITVVLDNPINDLDVVFDITNVFCKSDSSGSIYAEGTGGESPYNYNWTTPVVSSSQLLNNIPSGTYNLELTDSRNCKQSFSAEIQEPLNSLDFDVNSIPVSCFNGDDGEALVSNINGQAPNSIIWSDPNLQVTERAVGLRAGTYTVSVTDANGCSLSESVDVTEPLTPIQLSLSTQDVDCNGNSNGAISVIATGGTPGYSYYLDGVLSSSNITGLSSGQYFVEVEDQGGCKSSERVEIEEPEVLISVIQVESVDCKDSTSGKISVYPQGGVSPYSYVWNPSVAVDTNVAENLSSGTYEIDIRDSKGCLISETVEVTEPSDALSVQIDVTPMSCTSKARAEGIAQGGTSPYSYSWLSPLNQSGSQVSELEVGNYTLEVRDARGCEVSQDFDIAPAVNNVSFDVSSEPVKCFGENTGEALVSNLQGTAPYEIQWDDAFGQVTERAVGLRAGTYTVSVTDANGCSLSKSVDVTEPAEALVLNLQVDNVNCNGENNGVITMLPQGGVAPYNYFIDGTQTRAINNNLSAGNYLVQIRDVNDCQVQKRVQLNEPDSLIIEEKISDVSCFGYNDGSIEIFSKGGVAPYSYRWSESSFGDTNFVSNLSQGSYSVEILDANNCRQFKSIEVKSPNSAISLTTDVIDVSCFGSSDGVGEVFISGGNKPYQIEWNDIQKQRTERATNLSKGDYTVYVTDNRNCKDSAQISINQPQQLSVSISTNNNICFGDTLGTANAEVSGGIQPYQYTWNDKDQQKTKIAKDLATGNYAVTIVDANSCSVRQNLQIKGPKAPIVVSVQVENVKCFGDNSGSAKAFVSGSQGAINYVWNAPTAQNKDSIGGLPQGEYSIIVYDENNCSAEQEFNVNQVQNQLSLSFEKQDVNCFNSEDGVVTVNAEGGVAPYSYLWDDAAASKTKSLYGLDGGIYNVTVTDNNGCIENGQVEILSPQNPIELSIEALDPKCHNENSGRVLAQLEFAQEPITYNWNISRAGNNELVDSLGHGKYTVIVTDANGCVVMDSVTLQNPSQITLDASVTDISCPGYADGEVELVAQGGKPSYIFNLENQSSINGVFKNLSSGLKDVRVTDENNCFIEKQIVIFQPDSIQLELEKQDVLCFGQRNGGVRIKIEQGGTPDYAISFNNNSFIDSSAYKASSLAPGQYPYLIKDRNNCIQQGQVLLSEPQKLNASVIGDGEFCIGDIVDFNAVASGGTPSYNYRWSFTTANSNNVDLIAQNTEQVLFYAEDANGCKTDVEVLEVRVNNIFNDIIYISLPDTLCAGDIYEVEAIHTYKDPYNSYNYSWNTTFPNNQLGPFTMVAPDTNVTYTISVLDECNNEVEASKELIVLEQPINFLQDTALEGCSPMVGFLIDTVNNNNTLNYEWVLDGNVVSTNKVYNYEFVTPGTYSIDLNISSNIGCEVEDQAASKIVVYHSPSANGQVDATRKKLGDSDFQFNNISTGFTDFHWAFSDGDSSLAYNPLKTFRDTGMHQAILYVENFEGCIDSAIFNVYVEPFYDIIVPSAFTPDGQGGEYDPNSLDNNVFYPFTDYVSQYDLKIYNRWGELVFHSTDLSYGWDGYYKGEKAQQDVYVWQLKVTYIDGVTIKRTGDVTLLRK